MKENMFGKQQGRFDEAAALEAQRSLPDQFIGAFHAMPPEMQAETVERFNAIFNHPHRTVKFRITQQGEGQ